MDDKNDILKMLQDREDEFHLPLRENGWEKLEADLASRPVIRRMSWRWMAAAAVALLCLALSVPFFIPEKMPIVVSNTKPIEVVSKPVQAEPMSPVRSDKTDTTPAAVSTAKKSVVPTSLVAVLPSVAQMFANLFDADTLIVLPEPVRADTTWLAMPKKRKDSGPQPDKTYTRPLLSVNHVKAGHLSKKSGGWSAGLMAGSNNMAASPGTVFYDYPLTDPGPDVDPDPEDPDDPNHPDQGKRGHPTLRKANGGSDTDGSTDPTRYYFRHRLPITVGLSVRHNLSSRFALESGISYTYLYSDYYEGQKRIGEQQLHYIGVPLKINWTFLNKGPVSFYLSAGVMLEYCLSAQRRNTLFDDSMELFPWQASLNAGAGLQVALVKPVSLFVEPGIGYYFNTINYGRHSKIETIRTIHPLTFNLQVGIRFSY